MKKTLLQAVVSSRGRKKKQFLESQADLSDGVTLLNLNVCLLKLCPEVEALCHAMGNDT